LISQNPDIGLKLAAEIRSFFIEALNPVAPKAQKKVADRIPDGLDLEAQIYSPPKYEEEEEEEEEFSYPGLGSPFEIESTVLKSDSDDSKKHQQPINSEWDTFYLTDKNKQAPKDKEASKYPPVIELTNDMLGLKDLKLSFGTSSHGKHSKSKKKREKIHILKNEEMPPGVDSDENSDKEQTTEIDQLAKVDLLSELKPNEALPVPKYYSSKLLPDNSKEKKESRKRDHKKQREKGSSKSGKEIDNSKKREKERKDKERDRDGKDKRKIRDKSHDKDNFEADLLGLGPLPKEEKIEKKKDTSSRGDQKKKAERPLIDLSELEPEARTSSVSSTSLLTFDTNSGVETNNKKNSRGNLSEKSEQKNRHRPRKDKDENKRHKERDRNRDNKQNNRDQKAKPSNKDQVKPGSKERSSSSSDNKPNDFPQHPIQRPLAKDNLLSLVYSIVVSPSERNQISVAIEITNITDRNGVTLSELTFNISPTINLKLASDANLRLSGVLLPSQSKTHTIPFQLESFRLPQKLDSSLSYNNGSEKKRLVFQLNFPCSAFICGVKITTEQYASIVDSNGACEPWAGLLKVTLPREATSDVSRACALLQLLLNVELVEIVEGTASLYGQSIQGHPLALLLKLRPHDSSASINLKCSDQTLASSIASEIQDHFTKLAN